MGGELCGLQAKPSCHKGLRHFFFVKKESKKIGIKEGFSVYKKDLFFSTVFSTGT